MPLLTLPNELLRMVADDLRKDTDVAVMALVCRRTHAVAIASLYSGKRLSGRRSALLCWASEFNRLDTAEKLMTIDRARTDYRWSSRMWDYNVLSFSLFAISPPNSFPIGHPACAAWADTAWVHSPGQMLRYLYAHPLWAGMPEPEPKPKPEDSGAVVDCDQHGGRDAVTLTRAPSLGSMPLSKEIEMFENGGENEEGGCQSFPLHHWQGGDLYMPPLYLDWHSAADLDNHHPDRLIHSQLFPLNLSHPRFGSRDSWYWTPLHLAAMKGHMDMARLLLAHPDTDIDAKALRVCGCSPIFLGRGRSDRYGNFIRTPYASDTIVTPLHLALCHRQQDMAILLLERGCCADKQGRGQHAIHLACLHGCLDVAQHIRAAEEGTHEPPYPSILDVQDAQNLTPLYCAYAGGHEDILLWLLDHGADVNIDLGAGLTLLHLACLDGAFAVACRLVEAGADVKRSIAGDISPHLGAVRPLELACWVHHTKSRRPYARDPVLQQPRFERRRAELVRKLLARGAPTDSPSPQSSSSLTARVSAIALAAAHHLLPILRLLHESGADMAAETWAIPEAVNPSLFKRVFSHPCDDPVPTLAWLEQHGAPLPHRVQLEDALCLLIEIPTAGAPWKLDAMAWFLARGARPDAHVSIGRGRYRARSRLHPLHRTETSPDMVASCMYDQTPLCEALCAALCEGDPGACHLLLRHRPAPMEVLAAVRMTMEDKLSRAMRGDPLADWWIEKKRSNGGGCGVVPWEWFDVWDDAAAWAGKALGIILDADDRDMLTALRQDERVLRSLLALTPLPPCSLHVECALPSQEALVKYTGNVPSRTRLATALLEHPFRLARPQDWDRAFRLLLAMMADNWNVARYLIEQHGAGEAWESCVGGLTDEEALDTWAWPQLEALALASAQESAPSKLHAHMMGVVKQTEDWWVRLEDTREIMRLLF